MLYLLSKPSLYSILELYIVFCVVLIIILLTPLARVLLIYPVTDVGAYLILSYLWIPSAQITIHRGYTAKRALSAMREHG